MHILDANILYIAARRRRAKIFGPKLQDSRFSDLGEGGWGGGGVPPDKKNLSSIDRFEKILVPYGLGVRGVRGPADFENC